MFNNALEILMVSVAGLVLGSFLNVVIYRLPKAILDKHDMPLKTLLWPGSTAPCCGAGLHWYENVPVISWVYLAGKCGHCGQPISKRYPLVELMTSLGFILAYLEFGLTLTGGLYALFFAIAITLFFIDLDTYLLPDYLTYAMLWLGLLGSAWGALPVGPIDSILGAVLGYLLPFSVDAAYYLWRKQHGFGGGDFKLLAALGAWVGWVSIMPILGLASLLGLMTIVLSSLLKRQRLHMQQAFPFGPFLIVAGLVFIVFPYSFLHRY